MKQLKYSLLAVPGIIFITGCLSQENPMIVSNGIEKDSLQMEGGPRNYSLPVFENASLLTVS